MYSGNIVKITILFLALVKFTENRRLVKITNFKCISLDESVVIFRTCTVKPISRDLSEIRVNVHSVKPPLDNIWMIFQVKKRENVRLSYLYNITFDCCAFMRNRQRYPLVHLLYQVLGFEKYSNLNHTCPYYEDIALDKFRYNDQNLALLPLPYGEYVMYMFWSRDKKLLVRNEIWFKFYEQISYEDAKPKKNAQNTTSASQIH